MREPVLRRSRPVRMPWEETAEEWKQRMVDAVELVNQQRDVEGLCKEFSSRLRSCLDDEQDGRIGK